MPELVATYSNRCKEITNNLCFFQKFMEVEDGMEEERKQCQAKVESLESIVRMFELKNRNASDHGKLLSCHFSFDFVAVVSRSPTYGNGPSHFCINVRFNASEVTGICGSDYCIKGYRWTR